MSRRPLALLALSLLTLSLAACSDITAPTKANQLRPAGKSSANFTACGGGTMLADGRCR
jgi:hypothetical protein